MADDKILLWAEAKRLGVKDYRKMDVNELRTHIATINAGKGKGKPTATANGAKGKTAATTAVKGRSTAAKGKTAPATKGKTSVKPSPAAKSNARKPAAPRTAAQGKATRTATRGKATTAAKPRTTRGKTAESYRATIDNSKVDWNAESTVGTAGKRKTVLDALRETQGDKTVVVKKLRRYAVKWYPNKSEHDAERMLVWLVGRVAYDFVMQTGQHEPGVRAAYGSSTRAEDIRRRERRNGKTTTRGRGKPAAAKPAPARGKPAPVTRGRGAGRTAALKGKTAPAARKTTAKPAARKAPATRKAPARAMALKSKGR